MGEDFDDQDYLEDFDDDFDDEECVIVIIVEIVCPDDMCRGSFDGEGAPCGRHSDPSCVRWR